MSSLLVDVGNSRMKWALKTGDRLRPGMPLPSNGGYFDFDRIWKNLEAPSRILVSNVLGEEFARRLSRWTVEHWSLSAEFVRSRVKECGVENAYLRPEQLGVDRWVCLLAARSLIKEPFCVVDCGTAMTADVVDSAGRHRGGVICPGLKLMQDSLVRGTSQLSFERVEPVTILGRDTSSGIHSGTLTAAAGMIEKLLNEVGHSLGCRPKLLLTGGDAQTVIARLGLECLHIPDLVLQGLSIIDSHRLENRSY